MIHISQLSEARVEKVEDVVKVGDEVTVRVREIDNRGRINLTLRGVPQSGESTEVEPQPTPSCAPQLITPESRDRSRPSPASQALRARRGLFHGWQSNSQPDEHRPCCR